MKLIVLLAVTLLTVTAGSHAARLRRQLEREELEPPREQPPLTDVVIVDKNGDGSGTETRYDLIPDGGFAGRRPRPVDGDKKNTDEDLEVKVDEDEGKVTLSGHMPDIQHFHGSVSDMFNVMSRRFDDMLRRVAVAFGPMSAGGDSSDEDSGEETGPVLVRIPIASGVIIGGGHPMSANPDSDLEGAPSSDDGEHSPDDGCDPCRHLFGAGGHGIRMPPPLFSRHPFFSMGSDDEDDSHPPFPRPGQGLFGMGMPDLSGGDLPSNYNNTKTEIVVMDGKRFLKKTKIIRKGRPGAQIHITSVSYVPVDEAENEEPGSAAGDNTPRLPTPERNPDESYPFSPVAPGRPESESRPVPQPPRREPEERPAVVPEREPESDFERPSERPEVNPETERPEPPQQPPHSGSRPSGEREVEADIPPVAAAISEKQRVAEPEVPAQ